MKNNKFFTSLRNVRIGNDNFELHYNNIYYHFVYNMFMVKRVREVHVKCDSATLRVLLSHIDRQCLLSQVT